MAGNGAPVRNLVGEVMKMTVMKLADGQIVNINSDRDFMELLREKLGDDAAQWYEDRASLTQTFIDDWKEYFPPHDEWVKVLSSYAKRYALIGEYVEKLQAKDLLVSMIDDLMEIPGWDEY